MDVRIGVTFAPKELTLEMKGTSEELEKVVRTALDSADRYLWLSDKRGYRVVVPLDKLAYVEIEGEEGSYRVGFTS